MRFRPSYRHGPIEVLLDQAIALLWWLCNAFNGSNLLCFIHLWLKMIKGFQCPARVLGYKNLKNSVKL